MSDLRASAIAAEEAVAVAELPAACETPKGAATKPAAERPAPPANPLAAKIYGEIRQLTRNGVRDLEVQVCPETIRLRGRCSSYYCKQLAQHAAMHWIGKARLHNEIEVW